MAVIAKARKPEEQGQTEIDPKAPLKASRSQHKKPRQKKNAYRPPCQHTPPLPERIINIAIDTEASTSKGRDWYLLNGEKAHLPPCQQTCLTPPVPGFININIAIKTDE